VRNSGAASATGELLLLVDDDMTVPPEWVGEHVAHHQDHPGSIATGLLKDPYQQTGNDFQKFRSWLNDKWNRDLYKEDATGSMLLDSLYLTAGNLSVSKSVFDQLKGFDERLTDAEDYDLAKRARLQGVPLYFQPAAYAWHNDSVNCSKYIQRLRQYTRAHQQLIAIKPDMYENANQYAPVIPKGIKGIVFSSLCSPAWINSVEKGVWKWLPVSLRYKLYDMIVTANSSFFPDKVKL
jgi:GT2 family glycosyltransferase